MFSNPKASSPISKKSLSFNRFKVWLPLYILIIPGIISVILFNYIPMLGLQLAFKSYSFSKGIWGSPWIGFDNFKEFTSSADFWQSIINTIYLSGLRMLFVFPAPIVLALLINEIRLKYFKRAVQTISYLPHFISWVVIVGFLDSLLSVEGGAVNSLLQSIGIQPIPFRGTEEWFRPLYVIASIWKEVGWGTILYLAAISSINPELYEAAMMDGSGKISNMRYITLPGLVPIISIMLVLSIPSLLSVGADVILPLINPANMGVSEVIDTYVIRFGIGRGQYEVTTAIGFVTSLIGTTLLLVTNSLSKRTGGESIW